MPTTIEGTTYFKANEVADLLGISRQTLWRWRAQDQVPLGQRFRGREVVFTEAELEAIRDYAFRLEPAEVTNGRQHSLVEERNG